MAATEPTRVDFSELESRITGLKIARCNHNAFDEKELYRQITEQRYDFCRLKVPAQDEYAPYRLHQTGLPFFFSGSIRKYRTRVADMPPVTYEHKNLTFETYNGTQDKLLKDMLTDTWGNYPLGYYRSPFVSNIITKEQEIECVFQYYKTTNLNSPLPHNKIMFMKDGDNYVGVFTLNQIQNDLECNLAGILKPYRSGMYFHDQMNFKKEYSLKNGFEYFGFGARNENAAVQRIFQHLGFQTTGTENVFHITSLLTYSNQPAITETINSGEMDFGKLTGTLYHKAFTVAKQHSPLGNKITLQFNQPEILLNEKTTTLRISVPATTPNETLVVIRTENDAAKTFTCYLRVGA